MQQMNENRPKIKFSEVEKEMSRMAQLPKSEEAKGWENVRRRAAAKVVVRRRKGQFARKERSYDLSKMSRSCVAAVLRMLYIEAAVEQFRIKKMTVDSRTLAHWQTKTLLPRARQVVFREEDPAFSRIKNLIARISPESSLLRRPAGEGAVLYIRDPVAHLDAKAVAELRAYAEAHNVSVYRRIDREYVLLGHEKPVHIIEYALDAEDEISDGEEVEEVGYQEEDEIPYSNPSYESLYFR